MTDLSTILLAAADASAGASGGGITDIIWKIGEDFGIKGPYFISQVISTSIVLAILYFFAFKPIIAQMGERQDKIAEGLQYAEEMKVKLAEAERSKAETLKAASIEAQNLVKEARDQAKEFLEKQTQETTEKVEEMMRKSNEAIELERNKMLSEVRQEVAMLVVSTTAKVLSKELGEEDRKRFSESASKELASS